MNRYSTIKIEIESEFCLDNMADVWLTFRQGKTKITKRKSDGEIETTDTGLSTILAQEETALFAAFMPIAVQARWIAADGTTDSSNTEFFSLGDVLEGGMMNV